MAQPPTANRTGVFGNVLRACLGNLLEYYDWFVYASFSIYFAESFFPSDSPTARLLSTSVVFASGFLMRPLGGWLLGRYGDKAGRRAALSLSVGMMAGGSLVIACTPAYDSIGIVAPILFTLARLVQGLSLGGEWGSAAAYLSEIAARGKRGLYSGIGYVPVVFGQVISSAMLVLLPLLLSKQALADWGWRIPFLLGAAMGLIIFYLRRSMTESEHYAQRKREAAVTGRAEKVGLRALLTEYPRQFIAALMIVIGGTVAYYAYSVYMTKFLVNSAGIEPGSAGIISFASLVLFMLVQPFTGALSDKIGRRGVLLIFSIGVMVTTVPIFTVIANTGSAWLAFVLIAVGVVLASGYSALASIVKAELFPTKIRAMGAGFAHALGTAIFGGTTESIALSFKGTGLESGFYWYVVGCAGVTLIAVFLIPETAKRSTLDAPVENSLESTPEKA